MCGFIYAPPGAIEDIRGTFVKALMSLKHRGLPNRVTLMVTEDEGVLGHHRLPIIAGDRVHDHPRSIKGKVGMMVGEVFNYADFGDYECDTDLFVDSFAPSGEHVPNPHRFQGFWSGVAITNRKANIVVDHLGQKPVYYRTDPLVFASEIGALEHFGEINPDLLYASNVAKWGYDPRGYTPWREIKMIPPGHCITINFDTGSWVQRSYWDWGQVPGGASFDHTVKLYMGGELATAVLASGGLDSSAIVACLVEQGLNPTLFHVENDEARYAEELARHFNLVLEPLTLELVNPDEAEEAMGTPVDLGSVIPQYALATALAAKGFHVAVSGDGADELFGGYKRAMDYDSQFSDVFVELPNYHLPRLDAVMMRKTIELRAPFLSPPIVNYALHLDWSSRKRKEFLREHFRSRLPALIVDRDKQPLRASSYSKDSASRWAKIENWYSMKGFTV